MASNYIDLPPKGGTGVTSFAGRVGTVISQIGDYIASLIAFTPTGTISAIEVQAALAEIAAESQQLIIMPQSTIVGRNDSGSGPVEYLTPAEIATMTNSSFDHGTLLGLSDDDHTQYTKLTGRASGQTITGGTAASDKLILRSTSHVTKGSIVVDSDKFLIGSALQAPNSPISAVPVFGVAVSTTSNLYVDTNGDSHLGDTALVTTGSQSHSSSKKLYFDRRYSSGGNTTGKNCYIQALPLNPGVNQESKLSIFVDDTEVLGFSTLGGTNFPSGIQTGSTGWLIQGVGMRTTNGQPGTIRSEFSTLTLQGEKNSSGDYDIRLIGKNPFGGATASNILGLFSDTVEKLAVDTNGGLTFKGKLAHQGTTAGLYNVTPVVRAANVGQITDNSTGTAGTSISDVGVIFSQAVINNNFATLTAKLNAIETAIKNIGITS